MPKYEKTALTPDEVLRVAHGHFINGIDEHDLASLIGINQARIAEACVALRWAMENHKVLYRHVARARKIAKRQAAANVQPDPQQTMKLIEGDNA